MYKSKMLFTGQRLGNFVILGYNVTFDPAANSQTEVCTQFNSNFPTGASKTFPCDGFMMSRQVGFRFPCNKLSGAVFTNPIKLSEKSAQDQDQIDIHKDRTNRSTIYDQSFLSNIVESKC